MMSSSELKDDDKEDEEDEEEYPPIIIDNGSGYIKCGFGSLTTENPISKFESVVGHSKNNQIEYSDTYVGSDAITKPKKKLSLQRPIKNGIIKNWDDMEIIWSHIFEKELKIDDELEDSTILMSEVPLNTRFNREKQIQIMFERYNVNSYYTQNNAVLELYAHGKTTGLVVGAGFDVSYTVPVYQGYALSHAIHKMNIGGDTINKYLAKLLNTKGYTVNEDAILMRRYGIFEEIKKNYSFIAIDFWNEMKMRETLLWKNKNLIKYSLPDGNKFNIGSERFECSEIFFQPKLIGKKQYKSIVNYAYESILRVNIDVRKELSSHVVITGGSSLINGFTERFTNDLKQITPVSMKMNMNIQSKPNRNISAYLGASILSCLSFFGDACISSEEYEENGPKIVNRKCF